MTISASFDSWELTLEVQQPDAANPFADVMVTGEITPPSGTPIRVDGFCAAPDGSRFRLRFMPSGVGEHSFTVTCQQGEFRLPAVSQANDGRWRSAPALPSVLHSRGYFI